MSLSSAAVTSSQKRGDVVDEPVGPGLERPDSASRVSTSSAVEASIRVRRSSMSWLRRVRRDASRVRWAVSATMRST